ncbi:hypothetical protein SEA_WIDOW_64 [Gordonia phage Widow]|nr:hypothetical protein SEA_WIDOW_64 [Gordonia phage Widow]
MTALGPFIVTPRQIADYAEVPLSEVLLAIETGELQTAGSSGIVRVKEAERWAAARPGAATSDHDEIPGDVPTSISGPPVNPLTGLVHHELTVDPVTGRRLE